MKWYIRCIKNYANFSGRARRREYWMFLLFNFLIIFVLSFISGFVEDLFGTDDFYIIVGLYILFIIIPHLAVVVRRLHDINKSGAYWFIRFLPIIGPIWLLILLVEDSWDGNNKYGPNPKNIINEDDINLIGKE
ncbi:UNVERIFIED_CONTAM: hypothetical protein GTU68_045001 [Idotea baltica]|nr:hypothetical protein [Idotea baltica]